MEIIKIQPESNGSHEFQIHNQDVVPMEGWAIIPEDKWPLENFPYGEVETELIDGVAVVTDWTPLPIPQPEPYPEPRTSTESILDALLGE